MRYYHAKRQKEWWPGRLFIVTGEIWMKFLNPRIQHMKQPGGTGIKKVSTSSVLLEKGQPCMVLKHLKPDNGITSNILFLVGTEKMIFRVDDGAHAIPLEPINRQYKI